MIHLHQFAGLQHLGSRSLSEAGDRPLRRLGSLHVLAIQSSAFGLDIYAVFIGSCAAISPDQIGRITLTGESMAQAAKPPTTGRSQASPHPAHNGLAVRTGMANTSHLPLARHAPGRFGPNDTALRWSCLLAMRYACLRFSDAGWSASRLQDEACMSNRSGCQLAAKPFWKSLGIHASKESRKQIGPAGGAI